MSQLTPDPDYFDPKVLRDQFTDRNQEILSFETILQESTPIPILVYYGVGGTGKTSLLRYLLYKHGYLWTDYPKGYPHAYLNFRPGHTPLTGPEALLQARRQFRKNFKEIAFTRFDFLYGKWWERVHDMPITKNKDLLPEEIGSIAALLQSAQWVPGIGDAVSLVNLFGSVTNKIQETLITRRMQQWFEERVKHFHDINWKVAFERMSLEELTQLMAIAFGSDLADAATELTPPLDRILLFIDTYENLEEHLEDRINFIQVLAEELVQQDANVLLVIAGRDALHWAEVKDRSGIWIARHKSIWARKIYRRHKDRPEESYLAQYLIGELSKADAIDYLLKRNISDPVLADNIVKFTAGYPLALGIAADLLVETNKTGKKSILDLSDRTLRYPPLSNEWREEVVDWLVAKLLKQLESTNKKELIALTKAAAIPRWFNPDLLFQLVDDYAIEEKFEELANYSFVESYQVENFQAFRLHSILRKLLLKQIGKSKRAVFWNRAALEWFEEETERHTGSVRWRYELELLYHSYRENQKNALSLFQTMAERLVRLRQTDMLDGLLTDLESYIDEGDNSLFLNWHQYYETRLMEFQGKLSDAKMLYEKIGNDSTKDVKLRAYALCDLVKLSVGMESLSEEGGVQKALEIIQRCEELGQPIDSKLIFLYAHRRSIHNYKCKWEQGIQELMKQKEWLQSNGDLVGLLRTMHELRGIYGMVGNWDEASKIYEQMIEGAATVTENIHLQARLRLGINWSFVWSGKYRRAELESKSGLVFAREINNVSMIAEGLRDYAQAIAAQGRFDEAQKIIAQSLEFYDDLGEHFEGAMASALGIKGLILMQAGELGIAKTTLHDSLTTKARLKDDMGIPELLIWLGELAEYQKEWDKATDYYTRYLDNYLWTGRQHFECKIYCGLLRMQSELQNYDAIPPLLAKAEEIAIKYNYFDHLANIRLLQGHLAWNGHLTDGDQFKSAFDYYKTALLCSLGFNRFLLESLIGSNSILLPLSSIFSECRRQEDQGKDMLIALRDWWRQSTIGEVKVGSEIKGIDKHQLLLEFEENQRIIEPGDSDTQTMLVDQILVELEK